MVSSLISLLHSESYIVFGGETSKATAIRQKWGYDLDSTAAAGMFTLNLPFLTSK